MYATRFGGRVPLGWGAHDADRYNDIEVRNGNGGTGFGAHCAGLLPVAGIANRVSEGRVFYCPSVPTPAHSAAFRMMTFNTSGNPWPPSNGTRSHEDIDAGAAYSVSIGYQVRSAISATTKTDWKWQTAFSKLDKPPVKGMPRLSAVTNRAIFSDFMGGIVYTRQLHTDGHNVLYGNGAVKWVPIHYFQQYLCPYPEDQMETWPFTRQPWVESTNKFAIWDVYDRQ